MNNNTHLTVEPATLL